MSETQAKLGRMLLKGLVRLREQKGDFSLDDVGEMFLRMVGEVHASGAPAGQVVHQEIDRLAQYIEQAKKEIFSISTNDKSEQVIIDASQHLDEVIRATEEATHTIMDTADAIQAAVVGIGGDKEKAIMDGTHRIYEACNFQDITGQRITKVIKLLTGIEERVGALSGLFGASPEDGRPAEQDGVPADDRALLNGPQLQGRGVSQAEVDMLLASLGGKN